MESSIDLVCLGNRDVNVVDVSGVDPTLNTGRQSVQPADLRI